MKPVSYMAIVLCVMLFLTGCSSGAVDEEVNESVQNKTAVQNKTEPFTRNTKIEDVINAPMLRPLTASGGCCFQRTSIITAATLWKNFN